MSKRVDNWGTLLNQYLIDRSLMPFSWGLNDCVMFAADWVELATGERKISYVYRDALADMRIVTDLGGLRAAVTSVMGDPYPTARMADRGDIGILSLPYKDKTIDCLGVIKGVEVATPGETRVVYNPRSALIAAWKV